MHWLPKQPNKKYEYQHLADLLSLVFTIAVLCSSSLAFADTTEIVTESNELNWLDDATTSIDDDILFSINGKGAEATALEGDSKLAIILWDEGRQGNKGGTNNEMSSRPVITLTVIQK